MGKGWTLTVYGYARISTHDQDLAPQRLALLAAGVAGELIVVDQASGARASRPGLDQLLEQLVGGDVVTVWKLDRLGRSVAHLVALVDELARRGVELRSLTEGLNARSIAAESSIAETTARTQVNAVLRKLGVGSRLGAVAAVHQLEGGPAGGTDR